MTGRETFVLGLPIIEEIAVPGGVAAQPDKEIAMSEVKETPSTIKPIESFELDSCHFEIERDNERTNIVRSCPAGVWTEPTTSEYLEVIHEQTELIAFFDEHKGAISKVFDDAGVECKDVMGALKAFPMSENTYYKDWLNLIGETYVIPFEAGAKEYLIKVVDFHADGKLDEMEVIRVHHEKGRVNKEVLATVSGRDFDPLFQGLIKSVGSSRDESAVKKSAQGCEFPDLDPGFALTPPPVPEGVGAVDMPFQDIEIPSLDPCIDPCSPECNN